MTAMQVQCRQEQQPTVRPTGLEIIPPDGDIKTFDTAYTVEIETPYGEIQTTITTPKPVTRKDPPYFGQFVLDETASEPSVYRKLHIEPPG